MFVSNNNLRLFWCYLVFLVVNYSIRNINNIIKKKKIGNYIEDSTLENVSSIITVISNEIYVLAIDIGLLIDSIKEKEFIITIFYCIILVVISIFKIIRNTKEWNKISIYENGIEIYNGQKILGEITKDEKGNNEIKKGMIKYKIGKSGEA